MDFLDSKLNSEKMEQIKMDTTDLKVSSVKMVVGVGAAWYSAYSLQEWVAIATIFYLVFQIGLLIPKYYAAIQKLGRVIACCFNRIFKGKAKHDDRHAATKCRPAVKNSPDRR